uniref:Ig-like domain-containing protein n=1 Tax=Echeneis naucrates TaxID=173247 RepID=A0A665TN92_ECHNA
YLCVLSGPWRVTFQNQCALRGASILLECSYDYPSLQFVTSVKWSKVQHISNSLWLVSLDSLSSPPQFKYVGNFYDNCALEIYNLRPIDEGTYYFSFVTSLNRWRSKTPLYLQPSIVTEGEMVTLTCVSGCPTSTNVVWFRDGHPVPKPVFQAGREDAGRYYCAVLGQETVRSNPVALNVQYAPKKVRLSLSPSGNVPQGGSVTLTCSSEANPLVSSNGYSLFKDGWFLSSGEQHTISDVQPSHSGLYHCQAGNNISWRGVDLMNSTKVHLDVWYQPTNFSVSVDPPQVAEGSSVNLTCSSAANPAAVNYTWYKRTDDPSSSSMILMGSGSVLTLPSLEASDIGPYLCQARNSIGESFSAEVLLTMTEQGWCQSHIVFTRQSLHQSGTKQKCSGKLTRLFFLQAAVSSQS